MVKPDMVPADMCPWSHYSVFGGEDGLLRSRSETVGISAEEKGAGQSFLGGPLQLNAKSERNETENQFLMSRKCNFILVEKYCNVDFSEAKQSYSL